MSDTPDIKDFQRAEIEALLPWYVTGRLEPAEADRVAAYLAAHPDMERQLATIEEDRAEAISANEAIAGPRAGALDRLMRDIETAEATSARGAVRKAKAGLFGWFEDALRSLTPGQLGYVAAAAVAVIALQAGVIGSMVGMPGAGPTARYEVAGGPEAEGTLFLVRFRDDAGIAQVTDFLSSNDGKIVSGPRPGGVYSVRFGSTKLTDAERDSLLRRLQERKELIQLVMPSG